MREDRILRLALELPSGLQEPTRTMMKTALQTRSVRTAILCTLLLAPATAARGQGQVIGLLSLPEVFGEDVCDVFTPIEIKLYAAPNLPSIVGSIRVDRNWSFPPEGGCEGLTVRVHTAAKPDGVELPTREYGYELPAAIVLQQRGEWFEVRTGEGTAWLPASQRDAFFPLEQLLTNSMTYLTDAFDGRLFPSPGATPPEKRTPGVAAEADVNVLEFRRVAGRLWIHVDVMSGSVCESDAKPKAIRRGWLPAHAPSGEPTVWFYSRGC